MAWGPSTEVTIMAELAAGDRRMVTAGNLAHVSELTGLDCAGWQDVKTALPVREVPEGERWRLGLLDSLLSQRTELERADRNTINVTAMINSLCST